MPGATDEFAASLRLQVTPEARATAARLAADGWAPCTLLDTDYPVRLRESLPDLAPPVLYWRGDWRLLAVPAVAVIGTRRPSPAGRRGARSYAAALAARGVVVVSGNAPGADSEAHAEALRCGGSTIVFPPAPPEQYRAMFGIPEAHGGMLVVTPFVPGAAVQPWMFLARNRLVAAQCGSAIVAETGMRGGTLDTVGHLNRLTRPCFVVELPADHPRRRAVDLLAAGGAALLPEECCQSALEAVVSPSCAPRGRTVRQGELFPQGRR